MAEAEATLVFIILSVGFGCSIKVRLASGRGWGTVIICLRKKMKMVAFEIVIDIVFRTRISGIGVIVVVTCEGITLLSS